MQKNFLRHQISAVRFPTAAVIVMIKIMSKMTIEMQMRKSVKVLACSVFILLVYFSFGYERSEIGSNRMKMLVFNFNLHFKLYNINYIIMLNVYKQWV